MHKLAKALLFGLALALPIRALCSAPMVQRTFVEAGGYVRIADGVYAAPDISPEQRQRALAGLRLARQRIAAAYGAPVAKPLTIIAPDAREAARFGIGDDMVPGTAFISPVGTQVVLNMAHFSVDVTAHELTHAELAERLGFWTRLRKLPVWFDEGLAVQLDWRANYLVDCDAVGQQAIGQARTLDTVRAFWRGDSDRIVGHYRAAKCAAAQVLATHPPRTLYGALDRLRRGESFDAVFGPPG